MRFVYAANLLAFVVLGGAVRAEDAAPAPEPGEEAPGAQEPAAKPTRATPSHRIELELEVTGARPEPSVLFLDGGMELLRARMRALALEAGRPLVRHAPLPPARPRAKPPRRRSEAVPAPKATSKPRPAPTSEPGPSAAQEG